ncbi:MAG: hypothetical protein J5706_07780, partial [Elusimicrobiales bacterium]|nr:hypothetical protein [Elusimicrobiales bacterium]
MPNVNDKIMIELVLNAKKAIQEAQKAVNAISGIKDKQQKKDKETAEKQGRLAENATKKATAFEKKFSSSVSRDLNLLFRRFFGIYAILKAAQSVDHFARMGAEVRDLAKSAGMAEQKFEKLGYAAKKAGGSYASTAQTVKSLTLGLQNMKFGSGGAIEQAAMRYGLETGRDGQIFNADELLKSIARTMGSLKGDNAAQIDLANILGLDEATFDMVRGGEASYLKELAQAKATDKKDKDLSEQYNNLLKKLGANADYLGMKGGSLVLPPVIRILEILNDIYELIPNWIKNNKEAAEEAVSSAKENPAGFAGNILKKSWLPLPFQALLDASDQGWLKTLFGSTDPNDYATSKSIQNFLNETKEPIPMTAGLPV